TWHAPDEGHIGTLQFAVTPVVGKRLCKGTVHLVRLGHHDDPARLAVKPVDDAGATHTADARKGISAMMDESIDQGSGPIAGSGMDHKTGLLVDHDQAVIFIQHIERYIFALWLRVFRLRQPDAASITLRNLLLRLCHNAIIQHDGPGANKRLDAVPRKIRCKRC